MKRFIQTLGLAVIWMFAAGSSSADVHLVSASQGGVPDDYIVVLEDWAARDFDTAKFDTAKTSGSSVDETAESLATAHGGEVVRVWTHALEGFQIRASRADILELASDARVRHVEQNVKMTLPVEPEFCFSYNNSTSVPPGPGSSPQSISCSDPDPLGGWDCADNWGLDRIDQAGSDLDGLYNFDATGQSVHVYVIDSGMNIKHQEFDASRFGNGFNAITGESPATFLDAIDVFQDSIGHGTHVAAIIGGKTFGVAKQAILHPVKFIDSGNQGGTTAHVISGIDWILANHVDPAVINWSGGNGLGPNNPPLHQPPHQSSLSLLLAVKNTLRAGIPFVQSAGNQNDGFVVQGAPVATDACNQSLGGVSGLEQVIIVGGAQIYSCDGTPGVGRWIRRMGEVDFGLCSDPSFQDCGSNSGSCVDIWAPAAHIVSAYSEHADQSCYLSGTSMAAAHVTGVVALHLEGHPLATIAEIEQALRDGATAGILDSNPASQHYIGDDSPNLLLNSRFNGGAAAFECASAIGEVGQITGLTHQLKTIFLSRQYTNPVVFAQPPSFVGSAEAVVRIHSVQSDRFTVYIQEPSNHDGLHSPEVVSYVVLEAGRWRLDDGTLLEVGKLTTAASVGKSVPNSWATVSFETLFGSSPVVLSQTQTHNDGEFVKTRHTNVLGTGFGVALEEEEGNATPHGQETVGWMAISPTMGQWSGIPFAAQRTPDSVRGFFVQVQFPQNAGPSPHFLASMATYDGGNNAYLRYTDLSDTDVWVKVEEDTSLDEEMNHTTEVVGYLIFGGDGLLWASGQ